MERPKNSGGGEKAGKGPLSLIPSLRKRFSKKKRGVRSEGPKKGKGQEWKKTLSHQRSTVVVGKRGGKRPLREVRKKKTKERTFEEG